MSIQLWGKSGWARQPQDVSKVCSGLSAKDLGLFSALVAPPSGCLRSRNKQTPTQKETALLYTNSHYYYHHHHLLPGSVTGKMLWPVTHPVVGQAQIINSWFICQDVLKMRLRLPVINIVMCVRFLAEPSEPTYSDSKG